MKRIESEFVPLLIYNSKGGQDAKLLTKYKEPAWNYPVVRFLDGKGRDLIPRRDRIYSVQGIRERMEAALEKASSPAAP